MMVREARRGMGRGLAAGCILIAATAGSVQAEMMPTGPTGPSACGVGGCGPNGCPFGIFGNAVAGGVMFYEGNIIGAPSVYGYPAFRYNGFRWNNYETFHKNRVDYHTQPPPAFGFTKYHLDYNYGRCCRNHPFRAFGH